MVSTAGARMAPNGASRPVERPNPALHHAREGLELGLHAAVGGHEPFAVGQDARLVERHRVPVTEEVAEGERLGQFGQARRGEDRRPHVG